MLVHNKCTGTYMENIGFTKLKEYNRKCIDTNVTGFVKRGLPYIFNLSTIRLGKAMELKFGQ